MKRLPILLFTAIPLLFLLVYHQTFQAGYAYLDEAHQLWHNQDGSNYSMFLVQGRSLTGRVIEQLFGSVNNIADLRYIRLFSLAGWVVTAFAWLVLMRQWLAKLSIDPYILFPALVYFICSPALAISIGWASCAEIFLATLFGLFSGSMVFTFFSDEQHSMQPRTMRLLIAMVFGVLSLFLYQNSFGIFLLPFIMAMFSGKTIHRLRRIILAGVLMYLAVYVVYYLVFSYQLSAAGITRADRASITSDPLGKIRFFFSGPMPKAFALDLLYHGRSLFSKLLAPALMLLFSVSIYVRYKKRGLLKNSGLLLMILGLLALEYLPSLAVKEDFSSYRTMFPFGLTVAVLLLIQLFYFITRERLKQVIAIVLSLSMLLAGYLNYNRHLVLPLQQEYSALKDKFHNSYRPQVRQVYFIRPDKKTFYNKYGIGPVKDEFGNPSTLRDWVPEPITRQLVMEITHSRAKAEALTVLQFSDRKAFETSGLKIDSSSLLIDMDSLIINDH